MLKEAAKIVPSLFRRVGRGQRALNQKGASLQYNVIVWANQSIVVINLNQFHAASRSVNNGETPLRWVIFGGVRLRLLVSDDRIFNYFDYSGAGWCIVMAGGCWIGGRNPR